MLRAADLTPELVDAATEALLMSHRKFSETRLEAMRFTAWTRAVLSPRVSQVGGLIRVRVDQRLAYLGRWIVPAGSGFTRGACACGG